MINNQWLELPISRTNFDGSKCSSHWSSNVDKHKELLTGSKEEMDTF